LAFFPAAVRRSGGDVGLSRWVPSLGNRADGHGRAVHDPAMLVALLL
jgi:hypothetical protein